MTASDRGSWILRVGFFLSLLGLAVFFRPFGPSILRSLLPVALCAVACLWLASRLQRTRFAALLAGGVGLLLGACLGALLVSLLSPVIPPNAGPFFRLLLPLCTGFLGLSAGIAHASFFDFSRLRFSDEIALPTANALRFIDTSALIDGRIAELADAGFLDGLFVIPQFVLNELQTVADTADTLRRNRGRRGLDVVAQLQKIPGIRVEISPVDYGDVRKVDLKLIEAAKERNAQIVTTDCNLRKLADVQGVRVLNINELAIALRPVVLQGETMRVFIAKAGKESTQGVAYLEDGTMVVVENARSQVAKTIDIVVTGIVQSATGKMIFARYEDGRSQPRGLAGEIAERRSFRRR